MTTVNFQELLNNASAGFEPVPDDTYEVEVEKAEATTTSTGKPMIKTTLVIQGGPHHGRKLWNQHVISADNPNALGFFFEHMNAYGLTKDYFASNPPLEAVAQTLTGRRARATTGTKEYQGQDRNEVKKLTASSGPQPNAAPTGGPGPGTPTQPDAPAAPPTPSETPTPAPAGGPPSGGGEPF